MALINCPDCNKEVSSNAPACPGCGSPIATDREAIGSGVKQLTTTQETSKRLKVHSLLSGIMIVAGFAWIFALANSNTATTSEDSVIPSVLVFVGICWYLINRFRIWWHHK